MTLHSQPSLAFEAVIIRFSRQIYYPDETAYQLEVRQAPGPLPGGVFKSAVEECISEFQELYTQQLQISQFLSRFGCPVEQEDWVDESAVLGRQLYDMLPMSFRDAFPLLVQRVFERGQGLQLVLEAQAGDKADSLLGLPWELLFLETTHAFVAQSPRVVIVRRLLGAVRRSRVEMESPLNVIHVITDSSASSDDYSIDPELQEIERTCIRAAVAPGRYRDVYRPGSVDQLLDALRGGAYQIVHFLGHGEIARTTGATLVGRGYLRFVQDDGRDQWITGEQLQYILDLSPSVQVVVLNACHGGANTARSVALELVYHGVPYVVAVQGDILQEAAACFIKAFYTELQRGCEIGHAVAIGRMAIAVQLPHTLDWCLPVVYTSEGLAEQTRLKATLEALAHWMSRPEARGQLGISSICAGVLHLLVGSLLLLSNQNPVLPGSSFGLVATIVYASLPCASLALNWHHVNLLIPPHWGGRAKRTTVLRDLGVASLSTGTDSILSASILWLIAGTGFWELLSTVARSILFGILLIIGVCWGLLFCSSQISTHTRALVSREPLEVPSNFWGELVVIAGGYITLVFPWLTLLRQFPLAMPPWGNLLLSVLLFITGYLLCSTEQTTP